MSFKQLAKLTVGALMPLVLLAPLTAKADWPPGGRDNYMQSCEAAAQTRVDAEQAKIHCECGAQVIEKNFTAAEINALNDPNTPPPAGLREKLLKDVQICKSKS